MSVVFNRRNKLLILLSGCLLVLVGGIYLFKNQDNLYYQYHQDLFTAPGRSYESPKKVEDYFIEHLYMSPEEAQGIRSRPGVDGKVNLRLRPETTLDALIGNLAYYGFIKDEKAFRYALTNTKDTVFGKENALQVGSGTIDVNAEYRIYEDMSAWEIADVLLNKPSYFDRDEYGFFFMP